MPVPGFSSLSKATAPKTVAPAPAKAPAPAAKPSMLDQAKADIRKPTPAAPVKSRAQILREEAEAAEREEAAANDATEAIVVTDAEPEVVEPEPVAAAPAKPQTRAVALPKSSGFALSTVDRKGMANALLAFVEVDTTKKVPGVFPTLVCSGGEQGGLWISPNWQNEDVGASLPQGKKPLKCFYLGYRMDVTIWPSEFNPSNPGKVKPCNAGVIACNNVELSKLATQAAKNYQYTKKPFKGKFDLDANGVGAGRPSPAVEVICYLVDTDAKGNVIADSGKIVVLRTVSGYGPSARTTGNLARMIDPETQEIATVPMSIKIDTVTDESASQSWPCHFFDFAADMSSSGKAVDEAFEAFRKDAMDDGEFMAKFNDWMTGADRPMTEDTVARLKLAASL